ncbi:MAG TPA: hypothetical protein VF671_10500, partial [Pseudomonas sp.]|uniref:hypothetical protein n=1 Tax=Pseudomonas sp. TaxID=306 RepID=UPI002EDAEAEA
PAIMQPLLPEKESGNGTGAISLAQAKYRTVSIPLSDGFRYPSFFDRYWSPARLALLIDFIVRTLAPALLRPATSSLCRRTPQGLWWMSGAVDQ